MWLSGKPAGPRVQSPVGRRFFAAVAALLLVASRLAITLGSSEDSMVRKSIEARHWFHKTSWAMTDQLKGAESFVSLGTNSGGPELYLSPVKSTLETNTGSIELVGWPKWLMASSDLKNDISRSSTKTAPNLLFDHQFRPDWLKNSADFNYSVSRSRRRLHKAPSSQLTVLMTSQNATTVPIVTKPTETPTESFRSSRSHRTRRRYNDRRPARRSVMRHQPPLSCFSCASAEYEPLYSRSDNLFSFGQPLQFDQSCDSRADLHTFAPAIRCDATCITVLEPQYFGGTVIF